jgi:hypothetical protein
MRAHDEQFAQVPIAHLRNAPELRLAARRVLLGRQRLQSFKPCDLTGPCPARSWAEAAPKCAGGSPKPRPRVSAPPRRRLQGACATRQQGGGAARRDAPLSGRRRRRRPEGRTRRSHVSGGTEHARRLLAIQGALRGKLCENSAARRAASSAMRHWPERRSSPSGSTVVRALPSIGSLLGSTRPHRFHGPVAVLKPIDWLSRPRRSIRSTCADVARPGRAARRIAADTRG